MAKSTSYRFLLDQGWKRYTPAFDLDYFWKIWQAESTDIIQQLLKTTSTVLDVLGRENQSWWSNLAKLSSTEVLYSVNDLWSTVTANPVRLSEVYIEKIDAMKFKLSHTHKDLEKGLYNQIKLHCIDRLVKTLGKPDLIIQQVSESFASEEIWLELPTEHYTDLDSLTAKKYLLCVWREHNVLLTREVFERNETFITVRGLDLKPLVAEEFKKFAIRFSDYRTVCGQLQAPFAIRDYELDVQEFAQEVIQKAKEGQTFAALASGKSGTGKTKCMLAIAKQLQQQGFLVLVVDHEAALNFEPPAFLEKVVLIINEVDNWALDRKHSRNGQTEKVLSLLDGSTHESVLPDEAGKKVQPACQMVFLMTANTVKRADRALLRKGRIDLYHHFEKEYVDSVIPTEMLSVG